MTLGSGALLARCRRWHGHVNELADRRDRRRRRAPRSPRPRDVNVKSNTFQLAETNGQSFGIAGGGRHRHGRRDRDARPAPSTTYFDGTLTDGADSLTVQGNVSTTSNSTGRAVGGAILGAFTGPTITAETKPTVTTTARRHGHRRAVTSSPSRTSRPRRSRSAARSRSSSLVAIAHVTVDATDSPIVTTSVSAAGRSPRPAATSRSARSTTSRTRPPRPT